MVLIGEPMVLVGVSIPHAGASILFVHNLIHVDFQNRMVVIALVSGTAIFPIYWVDCKSGLNGIVMYVI